MVFSWSNPPEFLMGLLEYCKIILKIILEINFTLKRIKIRLPEFYHDFHYFRHAFIETLNKLSWTRIAALTQEGQKYSDHISHMQVSLSKFYKFAHFYIFVCMYVYM